MIEIRRCLSNEIELVMTFINNHWKSGHILTTNRPLIDWQHKTSIGDYNYMMAIKGKEILGILGYINTSRYDPALKATNTLWLALWKVIESKRIAGLGLRILRTLTNLEPHSTIAVNGINSSHPSIYKALNWTVGELQCFFLVNTHVKNAPIKYPETYSLPYPKTGSSAFYEMKEKDLEDLEMSSICTADIANPKTPTYFCNRFLKHPFYNYRVFRIEGPTHNPALISVRVAKQNNSSALKIVDFIGDPRAISSSGSALQDLLTSESAEYLDFWQSGIPENFLNTAGFACLDPEGPVVVPNYFEPYEQKNGRILFAYKSKKDLPAIICRADGDQDRPSII